MSIDGYNPYKKGFGMLVADIENHEARCVTPSRCEPFSTKLSAEGANRLGYTIAELRMQVAEMVATLKIARECLDNDELALCAGAIDAAMKVGGDLGSQESPSVWLCGIEWGGGHTPKSLLSNICEDVRTPPQGYDNWQENLSYIFNWQAMKLLSAIDGGSVESYKEFAERVMPFVHGSRGYFKMNLHPIGFKDTSHGRWLEEFSGITGFATKSDYLAWSTDYRLPQMRKWAENSKPKLILCLGKTYLPQFKMAFLDDDSIVNQETIEGKEMFWGKNLQNSLVVVIPFMVNRNGLTRNVAIQCFGERIRQLLTSHSTGRPQAGAG